MLDRLNEIGVWDTFRERHTHDIAWTYNSPHGASRRLDHIMATRELAEHATMRVGSTHDSPVLTNHSVVVMDSNHDAARAAEKVAPMWDKHVAKTMRMNRNTTNEQRNAYKEKWRDHWQRTWSGIEDANKKASYEEVITTARTSADGTIAETTTQVYPKRVQEHKYRDATDHKLSAWTNRLKQARAALHREQRDRGKTERTLRACKWDGEIIMDEKACLLYTSPSPRDRQKSRMPSSA